MQSLICVPAPSRVSEIVFFFKSIKKKPKKVSRHIFKTKD